ncbi:carbon storage regulator CsrA [Thermodesulfovibrio yellowstonii]|uniref:Translational regulator CsrA n=1 Tax=Thermodesulfovibrio yellowstonii TaxID=28262 RepID=A0A9W6GEM5_9BACT|nr:carbon storage regulator CsrA [Thermodesulfovibrio islandicus]GLI52481.1 hypothetical protein TISLANDTSLP1_01740 [Thermodesulfovibrio islandicus]
MLVLTRKAGQSIRIGDSIVIKIVNVDGSQVKIGIEAPKGMTIFREELYEKLKESNIEALKTAKELKLDEIISKNKNFFTNQLLSSSVRNSLDQSPQDDKKGYNTDVQSSICHSETKQNRGEESQNKEQHNDNP